MSFKFWLMSDNVQIPVDPSQTVQIPFVFYITFPFIFFCFVAISHLNFLSLKLSATGDRPFHLLAMEQSLEHDNSMQKNFSERVARVQREKSNKCSLCDYASSCASALRTHLKMHSGVKSSKCNQCDYASSHASDLRRHLKTHNGDKSNKCNQCDFASAWASALGTHLKTHQTNATLHPLRQALWRGIWKHTMGKSQTNVYKEFVTLKMTETLHYGSINSIRDLKYLKM